MTAAPDNSVGSIFTTRQIQLYSLPKPILSEEKTQSYSEITNKEHIKMSAPAITAKKAISIIDVLPSLHPQPNGMVHVPGTIGNTQDLYNNKDGSITTITDVMSMLQIVSNTNTQSAKTRINVM